MADTASTELVAPSFEGEDALAQYGSFGDFAIADRHAFRFGPVPSQSPSPGLSLRRSRIVENEVIPRLLTAHRVAGSAAQPGRNDRNTVGRKDIATLAAFAAGQSLPTVQSFVETLRGRGVSAETIVGDVLPAAARHVGRLWEKDAYTFVEVTFALSRFQQLLHDHAKDMADQLVAHGRRRRVLLSVMPGEQHTFGISVVEAFLRRAAWDVVPLAPKTARDILRVVSDERFDVVGLSAASDASLESMPGLVSALRAASTNRSVRAVVAGPAVVRRPERAAKMGADAVIVDLRSGIQRMGTMVPAIRLLRS